MKMKKNLLLIICLIFSLFSFSQKKLDPSTFNLPPGVVFHGKSFEEIDYSVKLTNPILNNKISDDFLKKFTKEEWNLIVSEKGEDYEYYSLALSYFNNLSEKIKKIYNEEELWYIYKFDKVLKDKIIQIK